MCLFQAVSGDYKYFDTSSGDQWTIGAPTVSPSYSTTSLWRPPPRIGMKTHSDPLSYYSAEEACLFTQVSDVFVKQNAGELAI